MGTSMMAEMKGAVKANSASRVSPIALAALYIVGLVSANMREKERGNRIMESREKRRSAPSKFTAQIDDDDLDITDFRI